ncbi:MAG: DNA-binding protein [Phycisphaerae bacterium]|nr:DNA-binding protein [Phycisphaerae bacterium]
MAKKKTTKTKKSKASADKPPTKSEIFNAIAENTGLTRKDVSSVFTEIGPVAKKSLKAHGSFTVPGICKLVVKMKSRVPAGERRNPFTGETKWMPAKPASKTVRARPIKAVRDMV